MISLPINLIFNKVTSLLTGDRFERGHADGFNERGSYICISYFL